MEQALTPPYFRTWASTHVMASLGGRTAEEALEAGIPPKQVWRAVVETLGLPASQR